MTTLDATTDTLTVTITPTTSAGPADKLADAELHFKAGPLAGLKLLGFGIWSAPGGSRKVTFPARVYSANGKRRTFTLLRDVSGRAGSDTLRALILQAFGDTDATPAAAAPGT